MTEFKNSQQELMF